MVFPQNRFTIALRLSCFIFIMLGIQKFEAQSLNKLFEPYEKELQAFKKKLIKDKSLWPETVTPIFGKKRTPVSIRGNSVTLSNKKGQASTLLSLELEDFAQRALKKWKSLTVFEQDVNYNNLHLYEAYLPKTIKVQLEFQLQSKQQPKNQSPKILEIYFNEVLEFVEVRDSKIYYTNDRLRGLGVTSIPISGNETDLLYRTRDNLMLEVDPMTNTYFDLSKINRTKNKTINVMGMSSDLMQRDRFELHSSNTESHFVHTKRFLSDSALIFPRAYTKSLSEKKGRAEKYSFKSASSMMKELLNETPIKIDDNTYQLIFNHYGAWIRKERQSLGWKVVNGRTVNNSPIVTIESVNYDWDLYVDLTEEWEIVDYTASKKTKYKAKKNNIHFFRWQELIDTTTFSMTVRKKARSAKTMKTSKSNKKKRSRHYLRTPSDYPNSSIYERVYETNIQDQKLYVSDNVTYDGDIVSIYLNDELVADKVKIRERLIKFKLRLKEGENVIEVVAENMGSLGKNTAKINIEDENIILENRTGESKKLLLIYNPN